jgi:hypothetical protein
LSPCLSRKRSRTARRIFLVLGLRARKAVVGIVRRDSRAAGGDPITARFMRQDFFTFAPQFKLMIAGNHKPGLRGVDEAIRGGFTSCRSR